MKKIFQKITSIVLSAFTLSSSLPIGNGYAMFGRSNPEFFGGFDDWDRPRAEDFERVNPNTTLNDLIRLLAEGRLYTYKRVRDFESESAVEFISPEPKRRRCEHELSFGEALQDFEFPNFRDYANMISCMSDAGEGTDADKNRGLANLESTCFYNSLLQQLHSIKSFRQFVDKYVEDNCSDLKFENLEVGNIDSDNIVNYKMCAFKYLFDKMDNTGVTRDDMRKFVDITIKRKRYFDDASKRYSMIVSDYVGNTKFKDQVYVRGQQDMHDCYTVYLSDVVEAYKDYLKENHRCAENTNIFNQSLSFETPQALSDLFTHFTAGAEVNGKILSDFYDAVLGSDDYAMACCINEYWNATKTITKSAPSSPEPFCGSLWPSTDKVTIDLEQYGYTKPFGGTFSVRNRSRFKFNFMDDFDAEGVDLSKIDPKVVEPKGDGLRLATEVIDEFSDHIFHKSIPPERMLSKRLFPERVLPELSIDSMPSDRIRARIHKDYMLSELDEDDKYVFYIACSFYNYCMHKKLKAIPEYEAYSQVCLHKARIFGMLADKIKKSNESITCSICVKKILETFSKALGSDKDFWDLGKGVSNLVYAGGECSNEALRSLLPKSTMLKIEPVDGQFALFINRTYFGTKNMEKIDLGNGEFNDYYGKDYFLSAVSVHSSCGSIDGGHYYTFKRSSEDDAWYEFNDTAVTKRNWGYVKSIAEKNCTMLTYTEKGTKAIISTENLKEAPCSVESSKDSAAEDLLMAPIFKLKPLLWDQVNSNVKCADKLNVKLDDVRIIKTYMFPTERQYGGITDENLLRKISANELTAIVDAGNTSALGGAGVDGVVFEAMGSNAVDSIKRTFAADTLGERNAVGGAIIHNSFNISKSVPNVLCVIQAVCPNKEDENYFRLFYSAYYNAIYLGIMHGYNQLVLPALGMGRFCPRVFDKEFGKKCAKVAALAINDAKVKAKKLQIDMPGLQQGDVKLVFTDHQDMIRSDAVDGFFEGLRECGATDLK